MILENAKTTQVHVDKHWDSGIEISGNFIFTYRTDGYVI